jgi:hypothetical protein
MMMSIAGGNRRRAARLHLALFRAGAVSGLSVAASVHAAGAVGEGSKRSFAANFAVMHNAAAAGRIQPSACRGRP